MYFNRPEFDRYTRFNSWGSARETFSWEDMCDIDIELPSIEVQQKYVNIYNAMIQNQRCYEQGLEDLKLTCFAMADHFKHTKKKMATDGINCFVIVREYAIMRKASILQSSLCHL